jgi:3-oxoacyl-[acyl-carrier protein] reductase
VNYAGNAVEAEAAVREISGAGGKAIAVKADVADEADVKRLFAETLEKFGQLDAVVHSAGVMTLNPIAKGDVEDFDRVIRVNLRGSYLVLSQAAQHVAEGGHIVAVSSSVVTKAFPTYGAYIASKAGVEGLVHVLANELRGRRITVNAVAPGPVATELFLKGKSEAQLNEFKKANPLERLGEPEDIGRVVSFLVSEEGGWINSQIILANGGFAF